MVSIIKTAIYREDEVDFRIFLEAHGYSKFHLFPTSRDSLTLNIHFENDASMFSYKLRDIESEYMDLHSNKYYYDLDQSFDDEAEEFFGSDEERN